MYSIQFIWEKAKATARAEAERKDKPFPAAALTFEPRSMSPNRRGGESSFDSELPSKPGRHEVLL